MLFLFQAVIMRSRFLGRLSLVLSLSFWSLKTVATRLRFWLPKRLLLWNFVDVKEWCSFWVYFLSFSFLIDVIKKNFRFLSLYLYIMVFYSTKKCEQNWTRICDKQKIQANNCASNNDLMLKSRFTKNDKLVQKW